MVKTSIADVIGPAITPYCINKEGQGPAWANSLFEDNAEYGFGMRLAVDANRKHLFSTMKSLIEAGTTPELKEVLSHMVSIWDKTDDDAQQTARKIKQLLPDAMKSSNDNNRRLLEKINEEE